MARLFLKPVIRLSLKGVDESRDHSLQKKRSREAGNQRDYEI